MYQEKLVYYLQPFKDIFELESTVLTILASKSDKIFAEIKR